jgi:hydrogenase expression/formation protein HypD
MAPTSPEAREAPSRESPAHEAFRGRDLLRVLAASIAREAEGLGPLRLMHVCGTHERSVGRFGLRSLLPRNVRIVAGPGCPVCVCPASDIAAARELALRPGTILASFGDMLAVPAPGGSLLDARAAGAELRVVYSAADAVSLARERADREVVFLSVGFETTTATTAAVLAALAREASSGSAPRNFSVVSSNRAVPPALAALLAPRADAEGRPAMPRVDGLILPGHVSVIIGTEPYRPLAEDLGIPCAVAGFEPVDLFAGILELLRQIKGGRAEVANAYRRAVLPGGNERALALIAEVYDAVDAHWRGIGTIPSSGLAPKPALRAFDALEKFGVAPPVGREAEESPCRCAEVMLGAAESEDCPLFGRGCSPEAPAGPCMVSEEGTCRIRYEYGGRG